MKHVLDKGHFKRSIAFSEVPETLDELLINAFFFSSPSPPPNKSKQTCNESLPTWQTVFPIWLSEEVLGLCCQELTIPSRRAESHPWESRATEAAVNEGLRPCFLNSNEHRNHFVVFLFRRFRESDPDSEGFGKTQRICISNSSKWCPSYQTMDYTLSSKGL